MFDAVIIGAGITGTLTAMECSRYHLKIALIDKENDIADGATMANSAIVHTGYDPEDGTLKARFNVAGARRYEELCRKLDCRYKVVGAYVAAAGVEQERKQDILAARAEKRGIPYEWLSGDEARKQEENLSEEITRVLSFPTTAIIYPWQVAIAAAEVAVQNGVELYLNTPCTSIEKTSDGYRVYSGERVFETRCVINAAGVGADRITGMVTDEVGYSITPKRGEYYVLDASVHYVNHVIFPVPGARGKGVLAVPTVYGNTLLGPNSDYIDGEASVENTAHGLDYVRTEITQTMKNVPFRSVIRTFAGLRPSSSSSDFIIGEVSGCAGFYQAASIESPGLASAPAIAEYLVSLMGERISLTVNEKAVMERAAKPVMADLDEEERAELIKKDPRYGNIICRCEQISEGEIVAAIHETCGARTVKGVKKRVRPGMGRCQGGFCEPRVLKLLARELNLSPLDIVLDGMASRILEKENR